MNRKQFAVKALTDEGQVAAVIATLNVIDADQDVTEPGAFGKQSASIVPAHNWGSTPLGKAEISENGREAIAQMQFNLDSEGGREWFSALKFDFENGKPLQEYSYGYDVLDSDPGEFDGRRVRFLKKLKVLEVSPVLLGAGIDTRTLAVKRGGGVALVNQFDGILTEISDFLDRTQDIRTLRLNQGRKLPKVHAERLQEMAPRMARLLGEVQRFVKQETGADASEKVALTYARYQRVKSRLHSN